MKNNETPAEERYLQGASSMQRLLISVGMPLEFLDGLAERMREAKRRMGQCHQ